MTKRGKTVRRGRGRGRTQRRRRTYRQRAGENRYETMSMPATRKRAPHASKKYVPMDFSHLLGKVKGIDDDIMKTHFKLYEKLVSATNASLQKMEATYKGAGVTDMLSYGGLQKEFSYFFNGMRLHELYFGGMCGENASVEHMEHGLREAINASFGSFAAWKKNFMQTGSIPGDGFVALSRDRRTGRLMNLWIIGELVDVDLLLVMDMWEHAFLCQFGLNVAKYQETYLENVNWSVVSALFRK